MCVTRACSHPGAHMPWHICGGQRTPNMTLLPHGSHRSVQIQAVRLGGEGLNLLNLLTLTVSLLGGQDPSR